MELFIFLWVIASVLTFVWTVGREHNYAQTAYPSILYKGLFEYTPPWIMFGLTSIVWPAAIFGTLVTFGFGGWTWPKKGVTYLK